MKHWISLIALFGGMAGVVTAADLTATGLYRPQFVQLISTTTDPNRTILWLKLNNQNYVAEYGSERSKAWLDLITSAIANKKLISVRYDPDYNITYTWCRDFSSSGNCLAGGLVVTEPAILGVYYY